MLLYYEMTKLSLRIWAIPLGRFLFGDNFYSNLKYAYLAFSTLF